MILRAIFFISIVFLVLGGACVYMARRSMALCPWLARHPFWVWGFFGAFVVLMFGVPLLNRLSGHHLDGAYWISYLQFSFVSTFFVYLLIADLVQFLLRRLLHAPSVVGFYSFLAVVLLALLSLGLGSFAALRPAPLKMVEIPIANLPRELDGFRIVQITDLHLGPLVSAARVQDLVNRTNALKPDLIAVTGDLVDAEADGARTKAELMKALQATHGVCFVTGNHEYYSGISKWLEIIRGMGWTVLLNEHLVLERGGAKLVVAGMPDPAARSRRGNGQGPNLARTLAGSPAEATKLLLFHQPLGYREAAAAGISLQLSGHTHGGQYFPWNLVVDSIYAYPTGLHKHAGMWIYTSAGTGFWGPPNRFLVPPELTLITLTR